MPTVYASGTPNSDGYLSGISVPTVSALLSNIRDTLTTAGWTVDDSQIAGGRIECVGIDNSDNCWVNFFTTNVGTNEYALHIQGDLDGTGVTLSPDEVVLPFFEGAQARLYLTADSAAGCIFIQNGASGGKSAHFGFLERLTDSPHSWMVGRLTVYEEFSYMAKDPWNVNWAEMDRYWYSPKSSDMTGAKQHLWDNYTIALMNYQNYTYTSNGLNPSYYPWKGAVDSITGLPILSDYGYLIGKNTTNGYTYVDQKPNPVHFPGRVRFARTGLASVDAGDQFVVNTKTAISGGVIGEYQGFIIKDSVA